MKTRVFKIFFRQNAVWFLLAVVIAVFEGVGKIGGSSYIKVITDTIVSGSFKGVPVFVLTALSLHLLSAFANGAAFVLGTYTSQKFGVLARVELYNHLNRVKYIVLESYKTGDLQSVIRNDINQATNIFAILSTYLSYIAMIAFNFWFMSSINLSVTIIVIVTSVFFGILSQRFLTSIKRYENVSRKSLGNLSHVILNIIETIDILKTNAANDYAVGLFNRQRNEYNRQTLNSAKADTVRLFLYSVLNNGTLFGCAIYLGYKAITGKTTVGEVLAYIAFLRLMLAHIDCIFRRLAGLTAAFAAWDRVVHIFDLETEPAADSEKPKPTRFNNVGRVDIDNVSYSYTGDGDVSFKKILDNFCLSLIKGNSYALTGQSGSGKTTLLKIILGFYDCRDMNISIDDAEGSLEDLQDISGFVPSDNKLFNLSIYDNIALGDESVTQEKCMALAKQMGIYDWLSALPNGLDTIVEENAANLSGGQRQAICILRTLAADKQVIFMDEPFASLDKDKESSLIDIINQLKKSRIVMITSHRESSIGSCDKEIQISNG